MIENLFSLNLVKTEDTRPVIYAGERKVLPVYQIPLEYLYYNDQNARIATWISKYKRDNGIDKIDVTDPGYNDVIQKFIEESNPEAMAETQKSIRLIKQNVAGVVMADGRIIDGNRRYTCLRRLAETDSRFGYFKAAILDERYSSNPKEIKKLELAIQFAEEEKVSYNPIDRMVGLYESVEKDKTLTLKEYCDASGQKESEVKQQLKMANLMVEFLQFINADEQYYLARDLYLDNPLKELLGALNKCKTDEQRERMKNAGFANFLMGTEGDLTRFIRKFKKIVSSQYVEEFLDQQEDFACKILDTIPEDVVVNTAFINNNIRSQENLRTEMKRSVLTAVDRANIEESKNMPAALAEKAENAVAEIDLELVRRLFDSQQQEVIERLQSLRDRVNQLLEDIANV